MASSTTWNLTKALSTTTSVIKAPLTVKIIKVSKKKTITTKDGEKPMWILGIADMTKAAKLYVYSEAHMKTMREDTSILMCNYGSKTTHIYTTNQFKVYRTAPITSIPPTIVQDAVHLISPPPAPSISVQEARNSPIKKLVSVSATIQQIEAPQTVNVRGTPTKVRQVTLKDSTANIRMSLWREMAHLPLQAGDHIDITNCATNQFNQEPTLNSTQETLIKVSTPPPQQLEVDLLGFVVEEITTNLMVRHNDTGTTDEFTIENPCLISFLTQNNYLEESETMESKNIETCLMGLIPMTLKLNVKQGNIAAMAIVV